MNYLSISTELIAITKSTNCQTNQISKNAIKTDTLTLKTNNHLTKHYKHLENQCQSQSLQVQLARTTQA